MITGVPYDAEIEYLESTGMQWIDTGIYADQNTTADLVGCNLTNNGLKWGFGARTGWANSSFCLYNGYDNGYKYTFGFGSISRVWAAVSSISSTTGSMHNFHIANLCAIDGVSLNESWYSGSVSSFKTPQTLRIFAAYTGDSNQPSAWRFKSVKIYSSGVLVMDLQSVRIGTEGAMYDRVTRKVFRNAGTGSFVLGPDVARPILGLHRQKQLIYTAQDYVQDGLIAMWDGYYPDGKDGQTSQTASEWVDIIEGSVYGRGTDIVYDPTNKCFVLDKIAQSDSNQFRFDAIPSSGGFTVEIVCAGTWAYTHGMSLIRTNGKNTIFVYPSYVQIQPAGSSANVSGIGLNTPFYYANAFTTGNGNNKLYYNGEYKTAGGTPGGLDPLTYIQAPAQSLANRVSGNIYAVRVYSRALTAAEILQNYLIDKSRFNIGGAS